VGRRGDTFDTSCSIPGYFKNVHKPFLLKAFCRWASASSDPQLRRKAMPHIKTWLRFVADPSSSTSSSSPPCAARIAWLLLGSHNLSVAAWGRLEKNARYRYALPYSRAPSSRPVATCPHPHSPSLILSLSSALCIQLSFLPPHPRSSYSPVSSLILLLQPNQHQQL